MSKNVVLNGDVTTGVSPNCPNVPVQSISSSTVSFNGKNIVLDGDLYTSHCGYQASIIASSNITVNGKKIALAGDKLTDNDVATSSSTMSIG